MSRYLVCPSCERHVRDHETSCPFCSAEIPSELAHAPALPLPPAGVSRAKAYAFRAALVASTAAVASTATIACGDSGDDGSGGTTSTGGASSGGTSGSGGSGTGGTGDDAGTGGNAGSGGSGATGGTSGTGGTLPMPYGCVFPDACEPTHL